MKAEDLREVDGRILDALKENRYNAPLLADELGYSKQYIRERLADLRRHEHVRSLGYGLYEFQSDPRNNEPNESG
ncbi:helix-turn-helix domain-containing protein [Halorarum salinum]|uniref:Uncharacterized protein n=1 Tax=Halorarum salinum TaxID=2743089 RepID=A0A7D5LDH1_9EURY|nr:hypothetical protein [Halobaculum salinum]QLG64071.1 hypothetical protein HUG12_14400 [Halobaculum salinum]